jgi:NADH-quinone oxidoreductase subunit J
MVLFLFVIMLLGTESLPPSNVLPWQRPVAAVLALLLAGEAGYLLFVRGGAVGAVPQLTETFGTPQGVGRALFNQYLLPFEITSVLLLVAMVGAIVLTRTEKGGR